MAKWEEGSTRPSGAVFPYIANPELLDLLRHWPIDGAALDSGLIERLLITGILECPDYEKNERTMAEAEMSFGDKGFVVLGAVLNPLVLGELRRYFRHVFRTARIPLGDGQVQLRYALHNERLATYLLHQFTDCVASAVGKRVKPSYAYLVSYQGGASLPPHFDRVQCEYSLSVAIDYSPEPTADLHWPLYLMCEGGDVEINLSLGDALLYRGRLLGHYRNPLPVDHASINLFLHYVDADFQGPLD